jgi:hypothetical protein
MNIRVLALNTSAVPIKVGIGQYTLSAGHEDAGTALGQWSMFCT